MFLAEQKASVTVRGGQVTVSADAIAQAIVARYLGAARIGGDSNCLVWGFLSDFQLKRLDIGDRAGAFGCGRCFFDVSAVI